MKILLFSFNLVVYYPKNFYYTSIFGVPSALVVLPLISRVNSCFMQVPTSMCVFPCAVTQHAHDVYLLLGIIGGVIFQILCVVLTALFIALRVP